MPDSAPATPRRHDKYDALIAAAARNAPMVTAVAHPCDTVSLESAVEAAKLGLLKPILVGPA
ncbi:MAG: phosphate acetyltransferase, partial [Proteobacteria bacterium]|nr:phosphate acetyltransferase [Pseudomonadota bacterium]